MLEKKLTPEIQVQVDEYLKKWGKGNSARILGWLGFALTALTLLGILNVRLVASSAADAFLEFKVPQKIDFQLEAYLKENDEAQGEIDLKRTEAAEEKQRLDKDFLKMDAEIGRFHDRATGCVERLRDREDQYLIEAQEVLSVLYDRRNESESRIRIKEEEIKQSLEASRNEIADNIEARILDERDVSRLVEGLLSPGGELAENLADGVIQMISQAGSPEVARIERLEERFGSIEPLVRSDLVLVLGKSLEDAESQLGQALHLMVRGLLEEELATDRARVASLSDVVERMSVSTVRKLNEVVKPGMVVPFLGQKAPFGWLLCDGSELNVGLNPEFAELAQIISTQHDPGRERILLPNLQGRFLVGSGSGPGLSPIELGANGGAEFQALVLAQMPQHSHSASIRVADSGEHTHRVTNGNSASDDGGGSSDSFFAMGDHKDRRNFPPLGTSKAGRHSHSASATIQSAGEGMPFSVMPPFVAVNYLIKY